MARRARRTVSAYGRVYHKFHGTYWCFIVLIFGSNANAVAAMPLLPGFSISEHSADALVKSATGKEVGKTIRRLKRFRTGDKTHAIDGVPFNIDCGPEFTIAVPVESVSTGAEQMQLTL